MGSKHWLTERSKLRLTEQNMLETIRRSVAYLILGQDG